MCPPAQNRQRALRGACSIKQTVLSRNRMKAENGQARKNEPARAYARCFLRRHYPDQVPGLRAPLPPLSRNMFQHPIFQLRPGPCPLPISYVSTRRRFCQDKASRRSRRQHLFQVCHCEEASADVAIRPPEALTHSEILTWPLGETDCHANAAALARNDAVGSMPQKVNAIAARIDRKSVV